MFAPSLPTRGLLADQGLPVADGIIVQRTVEMEFEAWGKRRTIPSRRNPGAHATCRLQALASTFTLAASSGGSGTVVSLGIASSAIVSSMCR